MGRRRPDAITLECRQWAVLRRQGLNLAGDPPNRPADYSEATAAHLALIIGRMRPELRDALDVLYVAEGPAHDKILAAGYGERTFWDLVARAHAFIEGAEARMRADAEGAGNAQHRPAADGPAEGQRVTAGIR